jgi:predicted phosphodiesterase
MKMNRLSRLTLLFFFLSFAFACRLSAGESIRITHGPYLQNMDRQEVTVVWVTDRNAISWVELAPDDGTHFYLMERPKTFAARNGIKTESRVHAVRLTGLAPGTRYRYRVYSQEVLGRDGTHITYGKTASTTAYAPYSFVTFDDAKDSMTFTMVNDIHGRSHVLEQLLKWAEPEKDDLVFFNGDMVSALSGEQELFDGFMDAGVALFARNVPMFYARGNHETRGAFATSFQRYFSPLSPELYYLVRQGPACFVVLDSGEDKPDSDIEYSGITDYDRYRTLEAEWLKEALKSQTFLDAPFKVVICHIPPSEGWHGEREILEKFVPLLNEAKIDIMLCGHLHQHIRMEPNDRVKFPILVNSNNAVVKATATARTFTLEVLDIEGKKTDVITIRK